MPDADLSQELANLAFLLDAAAAQPTAFDLETVLGKARRAIAALDAVLKLGDRSGEAHDPSLPGHVDMRMIREAIRRELPYGSPYE